MEHDMKYQAQLLLRSSEMRYFLVVLAGGIIAQSCSLCVWAMIGGPETRALLWSPTSESYFRGSGFRPISGLNFKDDLHLLADGKWHTVNSFSSRSVSPATSVGKARAMLVCQAWLLLSLVGAPCSRGDVLSFFFVSSWVSRNVGTCRALIMPFLGPPMINFGAVNH